MSRIRPARGFVLAGSLLVIFTVSAGAAERQIGQKIGGFLKKADQATGELRITDEEEQEIGAAVSERIRDRYGVVQDARLHRYVSLVGTVLAHASPRPNLAWTFIVLDTDGVNAFAAPGGYVHITRGALGLIKNESELACVLAHEITHVTGKHTLRAVQKGKLIQMGASRTKLSRDSAVFREIVDKSTEVVLAGFGRGDELDSDQKGVRLANAAGYAPVGLGNFLESLKARNSGSSSKQGLFASHPDMQERLDRLSQQVEREGLASTSVLQPRYRGFVSYHTPVGADVAAVEEGAAGIAGAKPKEPAKPKKKAFGLAGLLAPSSGEKKSAEVTGSAAARGVDRELGATGGAVKTMVVVNLTTAEIAAFKKEGALR